MLETGVYTWVVPLARTVTGFIIGTMLGIIGGWAVVIFNAMIGYPWPLDVHLNLYFVGIGLGAGLGAYVGCMNLTDRRSLIIGSLVLVMVGGIVGSYIGLLYGQNAAPNYLGRRYTIESGLHFGAATGAILVSAALGLIHEIKTQGR